MISVLPDNIVRDYVGNPLGKLDFDQSRNQVVLEVTATHYKLTMEDLDELSREIALRQSGRGNPTAMEGDRRFLSG